MPNDPVTLAAPSRHLASSPRARTELPRGCSTSSWTAARLRAAGCLSARALLGPAPADRRRRRAVVLPAGAAAGPRCRPAPRPPGSTSAARHWRAASTSGPLDSDRPAVRGARRQPPLPPRPGDEFAFGFRPLRTARRAQAAHLPAAPISTCRSIVLTASITCADSARPTYADDHDSTSAPQRAAEDDHQRRGSPRARRRRSTRRRSRSRFDPLLADRTRSGSCASSACACRPKVDAVDLAKRRRTCFTLDRSSSFATSSRASSSG